MELRQITEDFTVSPQIDCADLPAIAAAGFRAILCNRPDGEEPGQCTYHDIVAAAEAAGLQVRAVPIVSGRASPEDRAAFRAALAELPKPILAYCRTGTRSTMLWTMTSHGARSSAEILRLTAAAGYDMSGLVAQLDQTR